MNRSAGLGWCALLALLLAGSVGLKVVRQTAAQLNPAAHAEAALAAFLGAHGYAREPDLLLSRAGSLKALAFRRSGCAPLLALVVPMPDDASPLLAARAGGGPVAYLYEGDLHPTAPVGPSAAVRNSLSALVGLGDPARRPVIALAPSPLRPASGPCASPPAAGWAGVSGPAL